MRRKELPYDLAKTAESLTDGTIQLALRDSETDEPYDYVRLDLRHYKLCANFALESLPRPTRTGEAASAQPDRSLGVTRPVSLASSSTAKRPRQFRLRLPSRRQTSGVQPTALGWLSALSERGRRLAQRRRDLLGRFETQRHRQGAHAGALVDGETHVILFGRHQRQSAPARDCGQFGDVVRVVDMVIGNGARPVTIAPIPSSVA